MTRTVERVRGPVWGPHLHQIPRSGVRGEGAPRGTPCGTPLYRYSPACVTGPNANRPDQRPPAPAPPDGAERNVPAWYRPVDTAERPECRWGGPSCKPAPVVSRSPRVSLFVSVVLRCPSPSRGFLSPPASVLWSPPPVQQPSPSRRTVVSRGADQAGTGRMRSRVRGMD